MDEREQDQEQQQEQQRIIVTLINIVVNRGDLDITQFNYDKDEREAFLKQHDLWDLALQIDRKAMEYWQCTDKIMSDQLNDELLQLRFEACKRCHELLCSMGIDLTEELGKQVSWEELKEQLVEQLAELGISRENAEKAGLLNEEIITEGIDGRLMIDDTIEMRKRLEENGIRFSAKDGKITLEAKLQAKQGVSYEDTEENRRILDENEVEYIEMAQGHFLNPKGKPRLFVPYNWLNAAEKGYNKKLTEMLLRGGKLAMAGSLLGPAGTLLLLSYFQLKKNVLNENAHRLSTGEKLALKQGLTVYKEGRGKYGRVQPMYYYREKNKTVSVSANDVRIPDRVNGVKLTPLQMSKLRKGELVELQDAKGRDFAVRVDVSRPNSLREYYRENPRDKTLKEVPGLKSNDKEKLQWIAAHGAKGISQIFGKGRTNIKRDAFLDKYGLRMFYEQYRASEIEKTLTMSEKRKQAAKESMSEANGAIKETAESELAKMSRKMGR